VGSPRNLGDPAVSVDRAEDGELGDQVPWPTGGLRALRERITEQRRYSEAKETKPTRTGDRKSEPIVVPRKRGNPPQGTPWREGWVGSRNR
jgi:hypothetical protein